MATAIGIDLGTSNSCVAIARRGRVDVLANRYDEPISASAVHFGENGEVLVGNQAKVLAIHDPERTVTAAKRLMGRYFFSEEVKKAKVVCSYKIVEGPNHSVRIKVRDQALAVPEVSALVLREMKQIAEARLGEAVTQAVITVPAYFNDNQRQATRDAGRIAGLEVLRLLNEPTAAALAYGFGKGLAQRVAVYDLGGGTFDISILEIGSDVFEVLSTCGDTYLGGEDFDDRVIDLLAEQFLSQHQINLRKDRFALEKLKAAAESAKKGLSVEEEIEIRIDGIAQGPAGQPLSVQRTLSRREFGALVSDLVQRTFKVCDEALQQANLTVRDLDGVILVGGPTRLPLVRDAVQQYFQREPKSDVDPDQVVAMGAAIHAAALVGEEQESRLLDVTPLSLRIGVAGGLAETIIERNTPVPIEQTSLFTTFKDFQQSVRIRVYQGESRKAEENELLGEFEFSGFKNARRGEVRIEVTFEIDTDGIVNVTARDPDTAQAASTQIHLSSGLTEQEIRTLIDKHQPAAPAAPAAPSRPAAPIAASAAAALQVEPELEPVGEIDAADAIETSAAIETSSDADASYEIETDDAIESFAGGDVAGTADEIEFDETQLAAAAETPLAGPADADFELDLTSDGGAEATPVESAGEREIEFDDAEAPEADPLASLDEAALDSLAALTDEEAASAPPPETAPEATTMRRAKANDDLFGRPGSELSIFGDADDEEL
jgi:molecular chaperone DnaK